MTCVGGVRAPGGMAGWGFRLLFFNGWSGFPSVLGLPGVR